MAVRFWQATLPQHLIPILSVLVALIVVVTLPDDSGNDRKRTLSIQNSAIDPDNRILFWAEVGEDPTDLFDLGVRHTCALMTYLCDTYLNTVMSLTPALMYMYIHFTYSP